MNWFKRENRILEINIYGWKDKPVSEEDDWKIITSLYKKILHRDPYWHFFYEGPFNIIRCSKKFHSRVTKELDKQGVMYRENGEWEETEAAVRDNMGFFGNLFHHFSELAMKEHRVGRLQAIYERIGHCFLNHQFYNFRLYRKGLREFEDQWEFFLMLHEAIRRAAYMVNYAAGKSIFGAGNTDEIDTLCIEKFIGILGKLCEAEHSYEADLLQLKLELKEE